MLRFLKNNRPTPASAQAIALIAIALGSLAVTLFPENPDVLNADTLSAARATGIRLQRPQFGTPAVSTRAVSTRAEDHAVAEDHSVARPASTAESQVTAPVIAPSSSLGDRRVSTPVVPPAVARVAQTRQNANQRRYEADGQQLQLIYKSLRPDVAEHEIQILPKQPRTSVQQQLAAAGPFRRVSQSQSPGSGGAGGAAERLTLPAFQLPEPQDELSESQDELPQFDLPESLSTDERAPADAPHGRDQILSLPQAEAEADSVLSDIPLFDPAVLNQPAAPDVLATMPRVFAQDTSLPETAASGPPASGPPGSPVTAQSLPSLPQPNVREVTPAPLSPDLPLSRPTVEDTPPIPIAPGRLGYEPPAPGDRPSQPVPGLPLDSAPESLPIQPVPDALSLPRADATAEGDSEPVVIAPGANASPSPSPSPSVAQPAEPPVFGHSFFGRAPGTSGFRATVEADADRWMEPYKSRVMATPQPTVSPVIPVVPDIPSDFEPWWTAAVRGSMGVHADSHPVDVSSLLQDAMVYSPQVIAIKAEPEVQYRVVAQEMARFDWTGFLETTYDDLNDPVGSDLTTGNGEDRLITRKVLGAGGFRRRTKQGGEFRFAQEIGHENQNSRFFVPNNQGSTRLELSYRQPLLDGAGRTYNESEIVLARIQANTSEDEVVSALQDHLTEVTEAYWTLYRARAEFFQRQKLLASAQDVLDRLEGRSKVDTIPRQVLRARAAVARARTRIQRTLARVKDAEAQLRLRVNSPYMLNGGQTELLPTESPGFLTDASDVQTILHTALANRPDISEAIRRMRAAGVRLGVSRNELLPRLDFLVETYVADLAGSSNVYRAFQGQFADNRPGYTLGLEFEVPLGNRAAQARYEQRQWELKRAVNIFRATVEKSLTDVEIANREVQTAHSEILSRYQSMLAADRESRYLMDRFEVLPSAEDSATLLLEDLLDSFERLADEEASFVQAEIDHAIALIKLRKEMGTLLRSRNSRPKLDGTQSAWVSERLQSTAGPAAQNVNGDLQPPLFGEIEPLESPTEAESVLDDPANGNIQIGYSIHRSGGEPVGPSPVTHAGHSSSRPQSRGTSPESFGERPRSVPIPRTPTSWRRQPSDR